MSLVHLNFESQYLRCKTDVHVLLPDRPKDPPMEAKDFYTSGKKYKVLWLLHGTYGDYSCWVRKSMVEVYARENNFIAVMPSAMNSFFSNWEDSHMMGYRSFDYLTEELMPLIYNWFPASSAREDNFIAGLSMGGAGAEKYALNHPDKFAGAAVFSWAPVDTEQYIQKKENLRELSDRFVALVDNAGGMGRFLNSYENVWGLVGEAAKRSDMPRFYYTIGKQDFLYENYMAFKGYAQKVGFHALFEEVDGFAHEWRFWDLALQKSLDFFGLTEKSNANGIF